MPRKTNKHNATGMSGGHHLPSELFGGEIEYTRTSIDDLIVRRDDDPARDKTLAPADPIAPAPPLVEAPQDQPLNESAVTTTPSTQRRRVRSRSERNVPSSAASGSIRPKDIVRVVDQSDGVLTSLTKDVKSRFAKSYASLDRLDPTRAGAIIFSASSVILGRLATHSPGISQEEFEAVLLGASDSLGLPFVVEANRLTTSKGQLKLGFALNYGSKDPETSDPLCAERRAVKDAYTRIAGFPPSTQAPKLLPEIIIGTYEDPIGRVPAMIDRISLELLPEPVPIELLLGQAMVPRRMI